MSAATSPSVTPMAIAEIVSSIVSFTPSMMSLLKRYLPTTRHWKFGFAKTMYRNHASTSRTSAAAARRPGCDSGTGGRSRRGARLSGGAVASELMQAVTCALLLRDHGGRRALGTELPLVVDLVVGAVLLHRLERRFHRRSQLDV